MRRGWKTTFQGRPEGVNRYLINSRRLCAENGNRRTHVVNPADIRFEAERLYSALNDARLICRPIVIALIIIYV
jgi:hypothetical protein